MNPYRATAAAHPNIAFIKYWGNLDHQLRLPANSSLSMNLGGLLTTTHVHFSAEFPTDTFILNRFPQSGTALNRVSSVLDAVRNIAGVSLHAEVTSQNSFPTGAGIASSASGFAALAAAAVGALALDLSVQEISRIARLGSGSASRSVPPGFVIWHSAPTDQDSYAETFAPADHWDLVDCVAVVERTEKRVGSTNGHLLASTSVLQPARLSKAAERLARCKQAILDKDFGSFAEVTEQDSNLMHAVMMTSTPPLFYWLPPSLQVMLSVPEWRADGLDCCYTLDAGPNVHVICRSASVAEVTRRLLALPGINTVLTSEPGDGVQLLIDPASAKEP